MSEMNTGARNTWRMTTMIAGNRQFTARRRNTTPSARLPVHSALAQSGRHTSYSCDAGAPRPTRSRMTMTGSRFPGSRVVASDHLPGNLVHPQWYLWSSAIRLQLRGQPRIDVLAHTHRIPLASPCGHYRSQTWHLMVLRVNRRKGFQPAPPFLLDNKCAQVAVRIVDHFGREHEAAGEARGQEREAQ